MGYHTWVDKEEGFVFYSWIKGQVLPVSAGTASVEEQSSDRKYSGTENYNEHFLHTLSAPSYKPEGKTLPFPYEPQSHPSPPWDGAGVALSHSSVGLRLGGPWQDHAPGIDSGLPLLPKTRFSGIRAAEMLKNLRLPITSDGEFRAQKVLVSEKQAQRALAQRRKTQAAVISSHHPQPCLHEQQTFLALAVGILLAVTSP